MMEYTLFGESHGPAVGVLLTNVPAGLPVDGPFIREQLLRRVDERWRQSAEPRRHQSVVLRQLPPQLLFGGLRGLLLLHGDRHVAVGEARLRLGEGGPHHGHLEAGVGDAQLRELRGSVSLRLRGGGASSAT